MTKKDYELIARCFDDLSCELLEAGLYERLARSFADKLETQNTKFDRNKFLIACGIETELQQIEREAKEKLNTDLQRQYG